MPGTLKLAIRAFALGINLLLGRRAKREGKEDQTMDKPMTKSMTVWGALIAGVGTVIGLVGQQFATGHLDYGVLAPRILEVVGLMVAAIGARRALGGVK